MENLTHYQNLIKQFMSQFAELTNSQPTPNTEMIVIFDDEHKQYVLMNMGWTEKGHLHHTTLHVYLRDEQFWIEEDWTEKGFANYLLEQGISREKIILAFHPPQMRHLTDFVVS
jgi:DNA-binding GntR family transcriptional regulator